MIRAIREATADPARASIISVSVSDGQVRMVAVAPLELPPPSKREQQFQALWKQFYQTLEIKARHNEKCRMTHCPKRFWADMVEMKDEF